MFRHIWSKTGKTPEPLKYTVLAVCENKKKTAKHVKLNVLKNWCLGLEKKRILWHHESKFWFSKNKCVWNTNFLTNKNYICYKAIYHHRTYTISKEYLYVWLCNGRKTMCHFLMQFLTLLILTRQEWHLFGIMRYNWTR